jgi:hypothetical protein
LQILKQHPRGGSIATPLGKPDDPQDPHAAIQRDGQHVAGFHRMTRRRFTQAVDADMAGLDERGGAATGFDDSRVP